MVTQSSGKKYHGTLTKKLFRDMSRSAMQFLAMFLLCAMGTWCFSGLDANWRMLELSTETPIAQSNLADFWVKGSSFGKNDILKLRNLTGVKDVQARVTLEMDCPDLGDEVTLMVHGYDGDMRICTPIIRTGSELSASDTRGCLLEEQFAQAHNWERDCYIHREHCGSPRKERWKAAIACHWHNHTSCRKIARNKE